MKHFRRISGALAALAVSVGTLAPVAVADDVTDDQIAAAKNEESKAAKSVKDIEVSLAALSAEANDLEIAKAQAELDNLEAQSKLWDAIEETRQAQVRADDAALRVEEGRIALGKIGSAMYREGAGSIAGATYLLGADSLNEAAEKAHAYDLVGRGAKADLGEFQALQDVARTLQDEADALLEKQAKIAEDAEMAAIQLEEQALVAAKRVAEINKERDSLLAVLAEKQGVTKELVAEQQRQKEEAARKAAEEEAARIRAAEEKRLKEEAERAEAARKAAEEEAKRRAAEEAARAEAARQEAARKAAEAAAAEAAAKAEAERQAAARAAAEAAAAAEAQRQAAAQAAAQAEAERRAQAAQAAQQAQAAQAAAAQQVAQTVQTPVATAPAESVSGAAIVAYARQFVGVPYVWGASTPAGWDCSGFTGYVFAHFGIYLPRTSAQIISAGYRQVPRSQAQPGDIVWWPGHVGIYTGANSHIAAVRPGVGTIEWALYGSPVFLRVAG